MLQQLEKTPRDMMQARPAPNRTGIPAALKQRYEAASGFSLDDVRVHYNSDRPARIGALAYTQGAAVHVAPGQERHLPHELGHVVQQKQGRVSPTIRVGGQPVNNSARLEQDADAWSRSVLSSSPARREARPRPRPARDGAIQRLGERDAVRSTFPLRRGNRRGSIVDTAGISAHRLGNFSAWFDNTFWPLLNARFGVQSAETYYLARAEAVKMTNAANCDDYSTVTFAHIVNSTDDQWVYRCHMEPHPPYAHAFTITSPTELNVGLLPADADAQNICVVDGWNNYQIATLGQFCNCANPYGDSLRPGVNICLDNKLRSGPQNRLPPAMATFVQAKTTQFLAAYGDPVLPQTTIDFYALSNLTFDFNRPNPPALNDTRPNLPKALDMNNAERFTLMSVLSVNERFMILKDLPPQKQVAYFTDLWARNEVQGNQEFYSLMDNVNAGRRLDILSALPAPRQAAYLTSIWAQDEAQGTTKYFALMELIGDDGRSELLLTLPQPRRESYLRYLWDHNQTQRMSAIMNDWNHLSWVQAFILSLPSWHFGLTKSKALRLLSASLRAVVEGTNLLPV